ncbi:peptidyl-dipeptidase Dcp [Alteraurantiacibacter aestuarii]|uniref:Dipeptidyl carboxypeptidase II n=1 Tax=Alteraurantiacibacter aestuarii TaxID=650004 RepID=A0A844ZJ21_9SPHN|nr:M3 family metallopeptidase [Alteraurantiacibacter aestuarii]MXO87778.1 dipeptidyl carboxypeptidase II [Alteraurantiacibacter aestuarii]
MNDASTAPVVPSTVPQATGAFAQLSALPFHAPDFTAIADDEYEAAIVRAISVYLAEIEQIAANPDAPSFANTIVAMERAGQVFGRIYSAFSQKVSANINPSLAAADTAIAPQVAAMMDAIYLNADLFARVKAVFDARAALSLTGEDAMLLDVTHQDFVHRGAMLDEAAKTELRQINTRLSTLSSAFSKTLTAGSIAGALVVDSREELAGLTEAEISAAAGAARERGLAGKYVLTLQNTTSQALLSSLDNRDVRERLYRASIQRNQGGEFDTLASTAEMIALRTRKAQLFGEPDYASWEMYDRMATNPARALDFMRQMVPALAATQEREAALLNDRIAQDGHNFTVQPWDWPYYAEKIRQERYSLDENAIKQYFVVDRVLEDGVFYMAEKLYGLSFEKRTDIPVYHPDVSVYTVFDADGSELALFYFDPFARESKRGGAWMNSFIEQSHLLGLKPVIGNTQNVSPPAEGEPALASFDDVTTMFHEFGHALHGFFADQQYPSLSGTNTARDWVEFPSQFHENFAVLPEVLGNYARHWQTGERIPDALIDAVDRASKFNQGYALGENLTASLLDMEWHALKPGEAPDDVMAFEAAALNGLGLRTDLVPPRYRTPYFRHIFEHGYSAGYYSYLWTEALHHDAYSWVRENGGMTREMGEHIRKTFLGLGHSKGYEQMYRDFTGRDPRVEPLLEARGLLAA